MHDFSNITMVCMNARDPLTCPIGEGAENFKDNLNVGLNYCLKFFNFKKIVYVGTHDPQIEGVTYVPIEVNDMHYYNYWCIYEMTKYFDTEYVLSYHDDGYPLNPELFNPEVLKYDYVGAPCRIKYEDGEISYEGFDVELIEGGGLTLRTKRLMDYLAQHTDYKLGMGNEDGYICVNHRHKLIEEGFTICPAHITKNFVVHHPIDETHNIHTTFGFHGRDQKCIDAKKIMRERMGW